MKRSIWPFLMFLGVSGCSGETSKLIPLPDFTKLAESQDTEVNYRSKVDMLFVIDESTSMSKHQNNLSLNIDLFVEEFLKSDIVDFHIGVTCTEVNRSRGGGGYGSNPHNPHYSPYSYSSGGSGITSRCGTLLGSPPFLTENTQDLARKLPEYLKIGTDRGATESVFENAYSVLTSSSRESRDFYREDAHLILVFLTDARDQSQTVNRELLRDTLISMKKGTPRLIHVLSAIIPSYENSDQCVRDGGQKPYRIEEFTRDFDGQILSLCDPNFGKQLGIAGRDIYDKVARTIFIENGLPLPDTIELFYGSQVVDKKHIQYDPYQNMIILADDLELEEEPEGTKLRLKYTTADVTFVVNSQK